MSKGRTWEGSHVLDGLGKLTDLDRPAVRVHVVPGIILTVATLFLVGFGKPPSDLLVGVGSRSGGGHEKAQILQDPSDNIENVEAGEWVSDHDGSVMEELKNAAAESAGNDQEIGLTVKVKYLRGGEDALIQELVFEGSGGMNEWDIREKTSVEKKVFLSQDEVGIEIGLPWEKENREHRGEHYTCPLFLTPASFDRMRLEEVNRERGLARMAYSEKFGAASAGIFEVRIQDGLILSARVFFLVNDGSELAIEQTVTPISGEQDK